MARTLKYLLSLSILAFAALTAAAQTGADNRVLGFGRHSDEDVPKNVLETREKMRIEKDKKEFQEMMDRGEEVIKLTERVDKSFTANGRLSDMDLKNIESVEKDVRKIRNDLGGGEDYDAADDVLGEKLLAVPQAVEMLKTTTAALYDELRKTSRFTISAAAIRSTNAVLRITQFLRSGK